MSSRTHLLQSQATRLMSVSKIPSQTVYSWCCASGMDPFVYFMKAVRTEREHGSAGIVIGTDIIGKSDKKAAKIVIAHLAGVESDEDQSQWVPFPRYYIELWRIESRHLRNLTDE